MSDETPSRSVLSLLLEGMVALGSQALRARWQGVQTEWAHERDRVLRLLLRSALALMLIGLGLCLLIAWVVVVCWEAWGPQLLAGFGGVLLGSGAWLLDRARLTARRP